MREPSPSRRRFLARALAVAAAVPLGLKAGLARALSPLSPDNAQAKALKYTPDAAKVADPAYKAGSSCANCQFFTADTGACQIFPGHSVKATGWCAAWAKKA